MFRLESLFLTIFNLSINGSIVILCLLLARPLLKKAKRSVVFSLWFLVAFRLLCPFSFPYATSIIPGAPIVPIDILTVEIPRITTPIQPVRSIINQALADMAQAPQAGTNPLQMIVMIAATLWIIGILALLLYFIVSWLHLRYKLRFATLFERHEYKMMQSDTIAAPFIFGFFRPRIYLPYGLTDTQQEHVLAHEWTHLSRFDHVVKPLAFMIATLHWFNPLVWLAYKLICTDMELACDETVFRWRKPEEKKRYSETLLMFSTRERIPLCPIAFSEISIKTRLRNILRTGKYKRKWIVLALVALICLPNPTSGKLYLDEGVAARIDKDTKLFQERYERIMEICGWNRSMILNETLTEPYVKKEGNNTIYYIPRTFVDGDKWQRYQVSILIGEEKFVRTNQADWQRTKNIYNDSLPRSKYELTFEYCNGTIWFYMIHETNELSLKEIEDELNYVLDVLEADEADLDQYRRPDDKLT